MQPRCQSLPDQGADALYFLIGDRFAPALFIAGDQQGGIHKISLAERTEPDDKKTDSAVDLHQLQMLDLMRMDVLERKTRLAGCFLCLKVNGTAPVDSIIIGRARDLVIGFCDPRCAARRIIGVGFLWISALPLSR